MNRVLSHVNCCLVVTVEMKDILERTLGQAAVPNPENPNEPADISRKYSSLPCLFHRFWYSLHFATYFNIFRNDGGNDEALVPVVGSGSIYNVTVSKCTSVLARYY